MNGRLMALTSARISLFSLARRHATVPQWSRYLHVRRPLEYPIEDGLGAFLPPPALKMMAIDYQDGLLQRLNDEVRGTAEESKSVAQTVINTAQQRSKTLAFKYASEALNNSFFLDFLKPPPPPPALNHESDISPYLGTVIRHHEGSLVNLKSKISATVMGMSTSGYVWFVTDQSGLTAVIPTYGSGTLLVRSRQQHTPVAGLVLGEGFKTKGNFPETQSNFLETQSNPDPVAASTSGISATSPTSGLSHSSPPLNPSTASRTFHTTPSYLADFSLPTTPSSLFSRSNIIEPNTPSRRGSQYDLKTVGETLFPLFCVSVHECAWITAGYGIWGKEEWLKHFWTVLDWRKVSQAYVKWVPDTTQI